MSSSSYVFVVCCVGSGLCDGLITRLEESCRLSVCVCQIVCDLETSTVRRRGPRFGTVAPQKERRNLILKNPCVERVSNGNLS